jgi:hypothetical protein
MSQVFQHVSNFLLSFHIVIVHCYHYRYSVSVFTVEFLLRVHSPDDDLRIDRKLVYLRRTYSTVCSSRQFSTSFFR